MESTRIAQLLKPFLGVIDLSDSQLSAISDYLNLLLKWNSRVNLTAIRKPEEIVTRHFGESLFAARIIFAKRSSPENSPHVIDVGSGAGFPGVPIRIWNPQAQITLVEANNKKATFLREVIRTLKLDRTEVFAGRVEKFLGKGDIVTLRAVDKFELVLPFAVSRLKANGKIALLIGESQLESAHKVGDSIRWHDPLPIPLSSQRAMLVGESR